MFLSLFAAEEGPHISLKAEDLFTIGPVTVTNSILYGVIISVCIFIFALIASKKTNIRPVRGLALVFEKTMEFVVDMLEDIFKNRSKAYQYAPIFAIFFIFIFLSNLSGLLPLVGEGFTVGEATLFRPFTADLNATIALSVVAIIVVQYLSIKEQGVKGHAQHYFTDKPWNPINLFIGILELFGELTRVASLALRLFLNTAVGEILVAVFIFVGGYGASLTLIPIVLFEILVALIQGYVFTVLTATYLGLAIAHHDDHHETDDAPFNLEHDAGSLTSPSEVLS